MQTEKMRRSAPAECGAPKSKRDAFLVRMEAQMKFAEFLFVQLQPAIWQLGAANARYQAAEDPSTPEAEVDKAEHEYDVATFWTTNVVRNAVDLAEDFVTAFRAVRPDPESASESKEEPQPSRKAPSPDIWQDMRHALGTDDWLSKNIPQRLKTLHEYALEADSFFKAAEDSEARDAILSFHEELTALAEAVRPFAEWLPECRQCEQRKTA